MFNNAAEATWDEEHLYVALVQVVHELPGERQADIDQHSNRWMHFTYILYGRK